MFIGRKNEKENHTDENIYFKRRDVTDSFAGIEFIGEKPGFENERDDTFKKFRVKCKKIGEEI